MVRHRIKGVIGGGAATMAEGPVHGYREAAARAGRDLALGEDLCLGIFFHLAETREKAIREITPYYEEHVKMFAPLGFVPGITPAQMEAASRRGGWGAAGVPTVEDYTKTGSWFAGPPEDLVAYLKDLESRFPGLQHVNMSISMGTPKPVMLEQLRWFAKGSCRSSRSKTFPASRSLPVASPRPPHTGIRCARSSRVQSRCWAIAFRKAGTVLIASSMPAARSMASPVPLPPTALQCL